MNAGVYFITGKLGGGKSLISVAQIQDRLSQGRIVATNLDISLHNMFRRKSKMQRLLRLPDKPKAADLYALGSGNVSYDEEKNGLIVLDECGSWFNARDWNDPDRKKLLEWLLYARKLGWDIIFLVQDISMVDKQARKSVSEHVGYCRRVDKMSIPIFDPIFKLIFGRPIPKPKMHLCVVRLGDLPHSPKVDTMSYIGTHLYSSYDTKQVFRDEYPHGLHSVLPPFYTHGRYELPRNWNFCMRMTKIYFRRFSKVAIVAASLFAGVAGAYLFSPGEPDPVAPVVIDSPAPVQDSPDEQSLKPSVSDGSELVDNQAQEIPETVQERFEGFIIDGVASDSDGEVIYLSITDGEKSFNLAGLRSSGYVARPVNDCELLIMNLDRSETARVFTNYCAPDQPPADPPRMSSQEIYAYKIKMLQSERAARYRR